MFDWNDFLNLARALSQQPRIKINSDEACSRASVSRAYYAAFKKAQNFAINKDPTLFNTIKNEPFCGRRRNSHESVIEFLRRLGTNNQDKNLSDAGIALSQLKGRRTVCDYKDNNLSNQNNLYVSGSLTLAEEVLKKIP